MKQSVALGKWSGEGGKKDCDCGNRWGVEELGGTGISRSD